MSAAMASPDPSAGAPTITVRGEATLRANPDEAIVFVTLTALERDPGQAVADVSQRSEGLVALLNELGVAKQDRSTTGIRIAEQFEHTNTGRRPLGHQASVSTSVRLADRIAIGRLVTSATTDLRAEVSGPHWQIADGNPVRLEAARAAAANGRRKAEAYADGIGAELGAVLKLVEAITQLVDPSMRSRGITLASAAASGGPLPIDPGAHEVSAEIDVTFALEPS